MNLLIGFFAGASIAFSGISFGAPINILYGASPDVPFYSQFKDIQSAKWQKLGCGITSLAMLIEFYNPGIVSIDALLKEGLAAGAFINGAGWKHRDLALLAQKYGLQGSSYDLSRLGANAAFAKFEEFLKEGPVIASVHYKFDPKNPIPHLVVINDIKNGMIYYNDPAGTLPGQAISAQEFTKAWKKKLIVIRP